MLKLKNQKLNLVIFLLFGFGYFNGISSLQINDFWKSQIALIPLQLAALIYVAYLRSNQHGLLTFYGEMRKRGVG